MKRVKDLLGYTSIPGLPRIINSDKKVSKIMWIIFTIPLLVYCGIFLSATIDNYFEYEVITNIDVYREKSSQFPTVSFCVQTSLNQSLLYCTFEEKACTWLDFEVYNYKPNNTCYRFNSGKNFHNQAVDIRKTSKTDSIRGLIVYLYLEDYIYDINGNLTPYKTTVYIQNSSTIFKRDYTYIIDSGIMIPTGSTNIKIEREYIEQLPPPFNNCTQQDTNNYISNFYQYFKRINKTYLQKDCFNLCAEEKIKKDCNCSAEIGDNSACLKEALAFNCFTKAFFKYRDGILQLPEKCSLDCPLECKSIIYKTDQNYLGPFTQNFIKAANRSISLKSDGVYISIYYPNLQYTLLKEIPKMNTFDLVSNLGGTLSLFLGVCFVSVVQVIELLLEIMYFLISKKTSVKILVIPRKNIKSIIK